MRPHCLSNCLVFLIMILSVARLVHSDLFYGPLLLNDQVLAFYESQVSKQKPLVQGPRLAISHEPTSASYHDERILQQYINSKKRARMNLHGSLNMPRYLRELY